eukprot:TRINITY_DN4540_c0_g1_i4.p1 TRINITY_DN4540_c0_g1~~TRINITY_DN4540_c0_g1_i4.p1  ORF type:complete len:159 (-),score=31.07 TRINITY_DN4540_c0_g1_i4:4-480(-)
MLSSLCAKKSGTFKFFPAFIQLRNGSTGRNRIRNLKKQMERDLNKRRQKRDAIREKIRLREEHVTRDKERQQIEEDQGISNPLWKTRNILLRILHLEDIKVIPLTWEAYKKKIETANSRRLELREEEDLKAFLERERFYVNLTLVYQKYTNQILEKDT